MDQGAGGGDERCGEVTARQGYDCDLRAAAVARVAAAHEVVDHLLVGEVDVRYAYRRMDLMLVTGHELTAYEVKSDHDSLRRLPGQVDAYGRVADRAVLVTGQRHLARASEVVPPWWGLWLVDGGAVTVVREPALNDDRDPVMLAALLVREELVEALRWQGRRGLSRAYVDDLRVDLAGAVSLEELGAIVRHQLLSRPEWRHRALSHHRAPLVSAGAGA